jgi:hypothetical protein
MCHNIPNQVNVCSIGARGTLMTEQCAPRAVKVSPERGSTGLWVAIISTVIGGLILAALLTNEQIERRTAQSFLQEYYRQAAHNRDTAWNMLTPEYRSHIRGGRAAYDAFFGKMKEIRVSQVDRIDTSRFVASLTYATKKGRASRAEWTRFQLTCSLWANKNPLRTCQPKDLKISDTSYERVQ